MFNKKIINELNNNKNTLIQLISGISEDMSKWKPDPDRWSILEIINHLIDIEIEDFRHLIKIILFYPKEPWPNFNETEWIVSRKYNQRNLKASLNNFIKERKISIKYLKKLKNINHNAMHSGKGFKGTKMRAGDLLASWIGHDLFHIKQITLLKWDILNKSSKPYSPDYSGFNS